VAQALQQVGAETGKEAVKQAGKIAEGVVGGISGVELVGDIKPMGEQELVGKKAEDEGKKREEMSKIRGRDVEGEMEQVRKEKKKREEEEERRFLEEIKQKREAEERERQELVVGKKKRGAFAKGGKKPAQSDMSATGEFSRKKD